MIDPGHGGVDPGCSWGDLEEKRMTLEVGLMLHQELAQLGSDVALTRTADTALDHLYTEAPTRHRRDLSARIMLTEAHRSDLLISLHVNAAHSAHLGGAMLFYQRHSEESKRLAQAILPHLAALIPGNQNGVLPADLFLLRHAQPTAVLVELGFLTHPDDRSLLTTPGYAQRLARAVATGVKEYLLGGDAARPTERAAESAASVSASKEPTDGASSPVAATSHLFCGSDVAALPLTDPPWLLGESA